MQRASIVFLFLGPNVASSYLYVSIMLSLAMDMFCWVFSTHIFPSMDNILVVYFLSIIIFLIMRAILFIVFMISFIGFFLGQVPILYKCYSTDLQVGRAMFHFFNKTSKLEKLFTQVKRSKN